jgi:hypothetical protein
MRNKLLPRTAPALARFEHDRFELSGADVWLTSARARCAATQPCAIRFAIAPYLSGPAHFPSVKQTASPQTPPAKNRHNFFIENETVFKKGKPPMRIARLILVGSVIATAALAAPALAKHSGAPKTDDSAAAPASSSCHARQQVDDGSWTEIPCQEVDGNGQTQHKSAPPSEGDEKH